MLGKYLGNARERGGESPGACEKPLAIIALDRDFYGLELNEPGNSGEVFVLLCSFKDAFDAPGFVLRTMMSSITFGAAF